MERMRLRYTGTCRQCRTTIAAGAEAVYERESKTIRCLVCSNDAASSVPAETAPEDSKPSFGEVGVAGASARREYERRKAKDDDAVRARWGRFGGLAVALSGERPQSRSWALGAVGEERLGARLDGPVSTSVGVLHDRRIPGSKANIDHLVITSGGVWVVDAKRYTGRPGLKTAGGVLRPRTETLVVGGRDRTQLVDSVLKQVDLVRAVTGDVPVTGALCFVEADWPLIGGAFTTRGVHVLWPKRLTQHPPQPDNRRRRRRRDHQAVGVPVQAGLTTPSQGHDAGRCWIPVVHLSRPMRCCRNSSYCISPTPLIHSR